MLCEDLELICLLTSGHKDTFNLFMELHKTLNDYITLMSKGL